MIPREDGKGCAVRGSMCAVRHGRCSPSVGLSHRVFVCPALDSAAILLAVSSFTLLQFEVAEPLSSFIVITGSGTLIAEEEEEEEEKEEEEEECLDEQCSFAFETSSSQAHPPHISIPVYLFFLADQRLFETGRESSLVLIL
jgi:hypothetical protein